MSAATVVGILLLAVLVCAGLAAMAAVSGWKVVALAVGVPLGALAAIILGVGMIATGLWPWESGFWGAP